MEWDRCAADPVHFIRAHCRILWKDRAKWELFALWDCQTEIVTTMRDGRQIMILKARQQGFTWLVLCFLLWLCVFRPAQQAYLFSIGDREAKELTGFRLAGICHRLPDWMKARIWKAGKPDSKAHETLFDNGSRVVSLPSNAGRSYAATFVLIDEADFNPNLDAVMEAVEPTVDGGGWLIMLSTSDKSLPQSRFKQMYRAATEGKNGYSALFYGWDAHPGRDAAWHERAVAKSLADTGALDWVYQEYPSTAEEALAPRSLDKRIPFAWLQACYRKGPALGPGDLLMEHFAAPEAPTLPGLAVFVPPRPGGRYVLGADTAEGNPTSDESACTVLDESTGDQVAVLAGRFEPAFYAGYLAQLAAWYNHAPVLVERNNHGHAVLLELRERYGETFRLNGDDGRPGWLAASRPRAVAWSNTAMRFKDGRCVVRDERTFTQLCSVEGATLKAPDGEMDDRADSFNLALAAVDLTPRGTIGVFV